MRRFVPLLMGAGLLLALAGPAPAGILTDEDIEFRLLGEPFEGNSWAQIIWMPTVKGVDVVQAWIDGWTFDTGTGFGFTEFMWLDGSAIPGWSQFYMNADFTVAGAAGPDHWREPSKFNVLFEGDRVDTAEFTLHLQAYDLDKPLGLQLVGSSYFTWDHDYYNPANNKWGRWDPSPPTPVPWQQNSPVPEPASVAIWGSLAAVGLAGAWWRRRRKAA